MSDKPEKLSSTERDEVTGRSARRDFLRRSGRVAIAAPAAVLLLSAASKGAVAQTQYNNSKGPPPDFAAPIKGNPIKGNLLDP